VGKKGMENICVEELYYVNEEIRKHNGAPFNPQVKGLISKTSFLLFALFKNLRFICFKQKQFRIRDI